MNHQKQYPGVPFGSCALKQAVKHQIRCLVPNVLF